LSDVLPALATRTSAVYTDTLSKQEPTQYESRYADRDFLITVFPIGDDLVAKSGVDITERKHAEAALTESEQKLKLIYDNVSDVSFWSGESRAT